MVRSTDFITFVLLLVIEPVYPFMNFKMRALNGISELSLLLKLNVSLLKVNLIRPTYVSLSSCPFNFMLSYNTSIFELLLLLLVNFLVKASILFYNRLISCLLDLLDLLKSNHNFSWEDKYGGQRDKQKILSGYEQIGEKIETSQLHSGLPFFTQQLKAEELTKGICK